MRIFRFGWLLLLPMMLVLRASAPVSAGDAFTIGIPETIPSFNGLLVDPGQTASDVVIPLFQEALIAWTQEPPAPGHMTGLLAESWSVEADGTYTFRLNQAVHWSDGTPFSSADVIFTFDKALDPALGSPYRTWLERAFSPSASPGYRAIDAYTVNMTPGEAELDFLKDLRIPIVAKHIWEAIAVTDWARDPGATGVDPARVVGTGQYTFLSTSGAKPCDDPSMQDQPDTTPFEDAGFASNPNYGERYRRWGDFDSLHVFTYPCARGDYSPAQITAQALQLHLIGGIPVLTPSGDGKTVTVVIAVTADMVDKFPDDGIEVKPVTEPVKATGEESTTLNSPSSAYVVVDADAVEVNSNILQVYIDVEESQ